MLPEPRLSIVVPALNEADGIVATLESLQPLRERGHEVIVVDGGSTDVTRELAALRADRVAISPRGRARQMNAGASLASGDVLVFQHADTRLPATAEGDIADAVARGHRWGRFDVVIEGDRVMLRAVAALMNLRSRSTGIATGDQAIFVTREAFEAVGGFADQPLMEDIALSKSLRRACGAPACIRNRAVTSGRRWISAGVLPTILAMWRLRFAYWRGADPVDLARRYHPRTQTALLVFAKEPEPGAVKTRLAAGIGAANAALEYARLVERTLDVAVAARKAGIVGDVILYGTPGTPSPALERWARAYGVALAPQEGDDLGERMQRALGRALRSGAAALLIGTDCPVLDVAYLEAAASALRACDAVLGPAEDGGYVLVGLRRDLDLFSGMTWSRPDVMQRTRARLRELGVDSRELETLWDVDSASDLARWHALAPHAAD